MFYTKTGWLTPRAMACGYLHTQATPSGELVRLRQINQYPQAYQIDRYDFQRHAQTYCLTTQRLTDARKAYKRAVGAPLKHRFEPTIGAEVFA